MMKWMLIGLLAVTSLAHAQAPDASDPQADAKMQQFIASLHFKEGEIAVPGAQARFKLGAGLQLPGAGRRAPRGRSSCGAIRRTKACSGWWCRADAACSTTTAGRWW